MIPKLVTLSQTDAIEVQREAIWSLSNCTANKVPEHIRYLVENNVVEALLSWLDKNDTKTLVVILEGLVNMLEVGTKKLQSEELQDKIEECGGLDKIEALQEYPNQHVYELSIKILETYFQVEEMDFGN